MTQHYDFRDNHGTRCMMRRADTCMPKVNVGIVKAEPVITYRDMVALPKEQQGPIPEGVRNGWIDYPLPKGVFVDTQMRLTQREAWQVGIRMVWFALTGKVRP